MRRYLGGRFDGKYYLLEVRVERKGDGKTDRHSAFWCGHLD